MKFACYLALGDSMSIDVYPNLDHAERSGGGQPRNGLGAASLLFRNDDQVWPEFKGRDLVSHHAGVEQEAHASDGATTDDVVEAQLPRLEASDSPTLVTLTAGGNDLLGVLGRGETSAEGTRRMSHALDNLREVLSRLRTLLPQRLIICSTVYDPSDGLGKLEHVTITPELLGLLTRYNDGIRGLEAPDVRVVDLERHFAGHGASAVPAERWFWCRAIIEPGWLGASEIRRLWLGAIGR